MQHARGRHLVFAQEVVQHLAKVAQAGGLASQAAEVGMDDKVVGRRHPGEEATFTYAPLQDATHKVIDLIPAQLPTRAEVFFDALQGDHVDPARGEKSGLAETLKGVLGSGRHHPQDRRRRSVSWNDV